MPTRTAADPSFSNISRQATRLIDQMQKAYFNFCPSETWTPSVNLYETFESYLVCADLAGVEKEKIEVRGVTLADFQGHALMINAGGDNYNDTHKPRGGGGDRIVCGVAK